jgi:hypothetical protein
MTTYSDDPLQGLQLYAENVNLPPPPPHTQEKYTIWEYICLC